MTKTIIVSKDGTQTLTNKTLDCDSSATGKNIIKNLDASCFKTQTTTEEGQTFLVQSDGTWVLGKITQYKRVSTFTGETGNSKTLYYLDTTYEGFTKGLFIYDTTTSTFVPCSIAGNVQVDGVTITYTSDDKIEVKDAGLTIAKFNANAISTSIAVATGAVDTKVTTEKAVRNLVDTFAKTLEFTMDSTSYVLTATLKDNLGTVLSTQTVDLPLETLVVKVEYDNDNQRFIITLKDGTKQYIPATDILRGVVTEEATQTLKNKTINASENTVSNIDVSNLKAQTASDKSKSFIVQSDGSWALGNVQQYKRVSTFTGEVGNSETLYYLDTAYTGYNSGLYIYDTTTSAFVIASISGSVALDNVTLTLNSAGAIEVKDGGLTVAKFNNTAYSTAISSTSTDTEFATAKAVYTFANGKVPYANTTDVFTIGKDSTTGEYYLEE